MTPNQFDLSLPLRIVVVPDDLDRQTVGIHERNNRCVCIVHERDAEQIMRSVNAFPALLKACKMGLSDIERLYCGQEQYALHGNAAFKALKAAIKEAEAPI